MEIRNDNQQHIISIDDFHVRLIALGGYSKVYLAQHKQTKHYYALKVFEKLQIEAMSEVSHTFNERNALSCLHHPFILKMHCCFQDQHKIYMLLDLIMGGDLFYNLKKEKKVVFEENRVRFYVAQLVLVLEFLHQKGILFRDIKPENLLINHNGYIILCDFGLSKSGMTKGARTKTFCGTSAYYAPEILLGKEYDTAVDWWQLGTLMHELLIGVPPFYDSDEGDMFYKIVSTPLVLDPLILAPETRDIIQKFLQRDPGNRLQEPSIIKKHPYFSEIDWDKLEQLSLTPPYIPPPTDPEEISFLDEDFEEEAEQNTLKLMSETKKNLSKSNLWEGFEYFPSNCYSHHVINDIT